ncbi:MAG: hypothetical protein H7Y88_03480, partial [Phycisphaerales bacterium]|nr:hypothetical protein [Phycisphaerales bacterium]
MRALVITNPGAGSAESADAHWLAPALAPLGEVEVLLTREPGDAARFAERAVRDGI